MTQSQKKNSKGRRQSQTASRTRRDSLDQALWPDDADSRRQAIEWAEAIVEQALGMLWRAFDRLAANELKDRPNLIAMSPEQMERALTQWHALNVNQVWAEETHGRASFIPIHEMHEFESRKGGNAMPPSNDIGFIHRQNRRWKLPVEAKLVPSSRALTEYLKDVNDKYVAGIAAPLVGECGMVGYILSGETDDVFDALSTVLGHLQALPGPFAARPHRTTVHARDPKPRLRVHHMAMSCAPRMTLAGP